MYDQPAGDDWMKALPFGNGRLGGMVFGGVENERIMLNESSIWSGWYREDNDRKGTYKSLEKLRGILREGKTDGVNELMMDSIFTDKGYGRPDFGQYQSFCDVLINLDNHKGELKNYQRDIDMSKGTAVVTYEIDNIKYRREYFSSYPDQVIVMKLSTDSDAGLSGSIGLSSLHKKSNVKANENKLIFNGEVDTKSKENKGLEFEAQLITIPNGGSIKSKNEKLWIENSKSVTIIVAGATNYQMTYPNYYGTSASIKNNKTLKAIAGKDFKELKERHFKDFSNLFSRVDLDLGQDTTYLNMPINKRLVKYRKNKEDRHLETLLFQYGRYLLISSSRPGGLPANLQGLWNNSNTPPWNSDYHLNINLEMNYWPAEVTNLSECSLPLIEWTDDLRKAGEKTAKTHFNTEGWVTTHTSNVWGFSAMGPARGIHMFEPQSAAWISLNIYEHFAFTNDVEFLKEKGWPILKGAAQFWLENLQEYPGGILVSSPTYSPEHGPLTKGAYYDQQVIWELFTDIINVREHLPEEKEFINKVTEARDRLWPLKIGKFGQLAEWMDNEIIEEDSSLATYVPNNKHRHLSHLVGLYPGSQITVEETPELAEAAKTSLNYRGDSGTGWSKAWKINCWARLNDGDRAWKMASEHLAKNMYDNLLDICPPFQIDGNFGYTSGIAEMLIQSHNGTIKLLPALPKAWNKGSVKGLKARGGFVCDITWNNGTITEAVIRSEKGGKIPVVYGTEKFVVDVEAGGEYTYQSK
ncbi:glycoside hydrolase N-terminal domain-containing protein [Polaribacter haliotis]|uniref:Glycoside hydrolase N-terminal domain-containing protein n=1 Tax=Polaribacter haliotis TaxID=1888915 RepID=A0A7L8AIY4_9FLAO|nr:glycoside hydrolase N-terminal domain-containing protein [Polaribacter haliotis]QOD61759.1 glycoside hydrolase N-terminal domain-containing protein [Polaribacter haliotis]